MQLSRYFKGIAPVLILGLSLFAFLVRVLVYPQVGLLNNFLLFLLTLAVISLLWVVLNAYHHFLERRLPFERGIVKRLLVQVVGGLLVLYLMRAAMIILLGDYVASRVHIEITRNVIIMIFLIDTILAIAITAVFFGKHFFEAWKNQLIQKERLAKEAAQLQLQNLRNQVNPHFLFNSLSSLHSLIDEQPVLAKDFLEQMVKVYRYVLQHRDEELVALKTEVDFIQNYLSLLKTRFGQALEVQLIVSPHDYQKRLVPATLQMLVENAVKHNIASVREPLSIHIYTNQGILSVSNNLQLKSQVETSNKQGLENLRQLYKALTGQEIIVRSTQYLWEVKVPLV